MKKFPLIILLLVLCLFILACSQAESYANNLTEEPTVSSESITDHHGFVWIVPPTFEYDYIFYCVICDFFALDTRWGKFIDRETGELMDETNFGNGHGTPWERIFYDPEQNLIGVVDAGPIWMYPFDEFFEMYSSFCSGYFVVVGQVSSSWDGSDEDGWYLKPTGKYAVMYNDRFITDFLFDDYNDERGRSATIAMGMEGNWGLIDRNGNVALPFVFEHIVVIDNDTAFAKYNGRYGILDLRSSIVRSPQIQINGEIVRISFGDQQPIIVDGRTLVPLRVVMEALGFEVGWEPTQNRINLKKPEFDISLTIGSKTMIVNGNNVSLDVSAQLINNRTMVPLRAISEATRMEVRWDDESLIVDILTDLY